MRFGDTSQKMGVCEDRSLNTVLDGYPALSSDHFICREPRWVGIALRAALLLSGCGLALFLIQAPSIPFVATVLLWIGSGLAVLVATRPLPGSIRYISDPQGVYFPARKRLGSVGSAKDPTWLFVPWPNISSITVQLMLDESGSKKGVTFRLRANDEERRRYFSAAAMLNFGAGASSGDGGSILVGYPSAFKSPYKVAAMLSRFQRRQAKLEPMKHQVSSERSD